MTEAGNAFFNSANIGVKSSGLERPPTSFMAPVDANTYPASSRHAARPGTTAASGRRPGLRAAKTATCMAAVDADSHSAIGGWASHESPIEAPRIKYTFADPREKLARLQPRT